MTAKLAGIKSTAEPDHHVPAGVPVAQVAETQIQRDAHQVAGADDRRGVLSPHAED